METLKLLVKTSLFNKINDFMCFNIMKLIFNGIFSGRDSLLRFS